jgi:hypothetical protein
MDAQLRAQAIHPSAPLFVVCLRDLYRLEVPLICERPSIFV